MTVPVVIRLQDLGPQQVMILILKIKQGCISQTEGAGQPGGRAHFHTQLQIRDLVLRHIGQHPPGDPIMGRMRGRRVPLIEIIDVEIVLLVFKAEPDRRGEKRLGRFRYRPCSLPLS